MGRGQAPESAADGGQLLPGVTARMAHGNSGNRIKVPARGRKGRMVAGVCAGAADYFGINVTLVP